MNHLDTKSEDKSTDVDCKSPIKAPKLGKRSRAEAKMPEIDTPAPRKSTRKTTKVESYDEDALLEAYEKAAGSGPEELMLAKKWEPEKQDPTGWLMSEKLDGLRCYWNGKTLYSRNGLVFSAPDWFKKLLPKDLALDGELFTKRDDFQKAVSIVRKLKADSDEWRNVTYMIFDAPKIKKPFSQRIAAIKKVINDERSDEEKKHCRMLEQTVCSGAKALTDEMDRILAIKGEGVMIKDPKSMYEHKRSDRLLKVKQFDDAEAVIIGHEGGTGRCEGMLGALRVRLVKDPKIVFKVGTGFDDSQRRKPPKIGSTITFKHQGVSKSGTPRFPVYMRVHPDM